VWVIWRHDYFIFVLVLFMDLGRKDGEEFWVLKEKGKCRYQRKLRVYNVGCLVGGRHCAQYLEGKRRSVFAQVGGREAE
jgi:hypothetical protein